MDANWRPTQGTESTMDTSDWRTQLQPDSRQRIVNRIMDTLKRHLPVSGQDGLLELRKIAQRFEEKVYTAATSQSDYLRKISLKMLTMEDKTQNTRVNPMQSNAGGPSNKPIDSGISLQSQVHNPGQSYAIPVPNQNQQANNIQQSTQPMLQQHSQSVISQQQQQISINSQQQTPISQQPILPQQQQQQLLAQQSNVASMQHPQLLGQQNNVGDIHQHQGLLVVQQNNLPNLQQHQQQQQQLITNQHSANVLQQSKVPVQQQSQQNLTNLLQSQGPHSQPQVPQLQLMPQIQYQPAQLQQQLGLQQQSNPLQRDMQLRLQAWSPLLQQQNVLYQQKQLYQSQRNLPDSSSTSLDSTSQTGKSCGNDWQEEVYQKIKSMKESYLPELTEMHQKIAAKLQQHESLPHQPKSDQVDRLKQFKMMLERVIAFLQVSKSSIVPIFKEKMALYEKQVMNFINTNRPRKAMSSMQVGELPPPHMRPVSQPQSQLTQVQSRENQMKSQMQSTNLQSSVATMQQNNMASLQHNSIPSISGVSTTQQNMVNSMQPGANLDSSFVNSLLLVGASTPQQNSLNAPQETNTNSLSFQSSSVLQHQLLKQPLEQKMLQNQQFKHNQQRPLMLQKQMPPLHQINDINDKMRRGLWTFQQHLTSGQRSAYPHQQCIPGYPFPVSSPHHLLQAASPQIPQHSSPQVDQQSLPSLVKVSTPLQSPNSPFVGPTPPPSLAPSPIVGDSKKPISVVSSVSNAVPAESLAIKTPLLAEFSGPKGAYGNALAISSVKLAIALLFSIILWLVLSYC